MFWLGFFAGAAVAVLALVVLLLALYAVGRAR